MIDSVEIPPQEVNHSTQSTSSTSQVFGSLYSDLPSDPSQYEVNIAAAAWSAHRSKILAPQSVRKRDVQQTSSQSIPATKPPERQVKKSNNILSSSAPSPSGQAPYGIIKSVLTHTSSTEYDPGKPHEYDKIVKERLQKIQNEEMEKKRKQLEAEELERLKKQQELNEERARDNQVNLKLSGEEAWARRGQLTGDEAWARRGQLSNSSAPQGSNNTQTQASDSSSSFSTPAIPGKKSVAARMMERMGWKDGEGLGRDKQGMTGILIARKTDKRSGVIVHGGANKAAAIEPSPPPYASPPQPPSNFSASPVQPALTRILLLTNVVGSGDVDQELEGEIQEEASKFGNLLEVKIFEHKGVPDDECVKIFCVYESSQQAQKAMFAMNGRVFGGRVVKTRFYDENSYNKGDFKS